MSISVGIHPPKTPCTKGSHGVAKATIPNICKMPGPPAPFVPAPLPNIAKSELSPQGYSTTVKIEGNTVAIRGATFESIGDMASKGTGGGLISANTHGPAKFISPGSMTVKMEGKNVHLLSDPMLNNCGPSGSPPNTGATMYGLSQANQGGSNPLEIKCNNAPAKEGAKKFTKCEKEEICAKCASINQHAKKMRKEGKKQRRARASYEDNRRRGDNKCNSLNKKARAGNPPNLGFCPVSPGCEQYLRAKAEANNYEGFSPDHIQEIQLGGHPTRSSNLRWMSSGPNSWIGGPMKNFETTGPDKHTGVKPDCCA
jgi:Toxin PAAR-like domain